MKYKFTFTLFLLSTISLVTFAQDEGVPRPLTLGEYQNALTFDIEDLDNDTYVKFDNAYILDRYELKKPIFITGDDGLRKRVDLYKLIARDGLQDLGVMIFYTNEKDELFKALVPNYTASGEVWEMYFEDIHAIDEIEANFVLKLSYVLSREFSFQIYKGLNEGNIEEEDGTYGSDICFPGDQKVKMADGSQRLLKNIKEGDEVISLDPATNEVKVVKVSKLVSHKAENYAITVLNLVASEKVETIHGVEIKYSYKQLKATPNHPMLTNEGKKNAGSILPGEQILSWNEVDQQYKVYDVIDVTEVADGIQPVYSIEGSSGSTLVINGVVVRQKN